MKKAIVFGFLFVCHFIFAADLQNITYEKDGKRISINIALKGYLTYNVFSLDNPSRIVIDLKNTNLKTKISQNNLDTVGLRSIRIGHPNTNTLRLVYDLPEKMTYATQLWHKDGFSNQGIKIDLFSHNTINSSPKVMGTPKPTKLPIAVRAYVEQPTIVSKAISGNKDVIIVLDAGHGGKDPGAHGSRGSLEKNVTLSIAKRLKSLIDRQPGMKAVLTRQGDYYIELRERLNIARRYKADIFVSIHADAFPKRESNGASVFALSQRGATSEAARWLATKENCSELGGVNLKGLDDSNGLVRSVLVDLSQTATINSSLKMGNSVLGQLGRVTRLHSREVEQAGFVVLKSPDIPSILIETGFITNPQEERNLTSYFYQSRLTQYIFQGLKSYFMEYPPHGTKLEAMMSNSWKKR